MMSSCLASCRQRQALTPARWLAHIPAPLPRCPCIAWTLVWRGSHGNCQPGPLLRSRESASLGLSSLHRGTGRQAALDQRGDHRGCAGMRGQATAGGRAAGGAAAGWQASLLDRVPGGAPGLLRRHWPGGLSWASASSSPWWVADSLLAVEGLTAARLLSRWVS